MKWCYPTPISQGSAGRVLETDKGLVRLLILRWWLLGCIASLVSSSRECLTEEGLWEFH